MRDVKSKDYWKDAYKRRYTNNIKEIEFNGLNNLPDISFPAGVLAFCGLNGAGKSTIVSAIKDIIGVHLTEQDIQKIGTRVISGKATISDTEITCSNQDGERLTDKGWDLEKVQYLDCIASSAAQNYIVNQANIEELLEQYEEYEFPADEVKEINYLIGKQYQHCFVRELSEIDGQDSTIPYFCVEVDGAKYDSKDMGYGEHFLLYLFWRITNVEKDTLLIIEEPETYISISSQIHFANYLGKQMAQKGVKVILTTHSPYILSNIRNENIRIVSRMGNIASIITPTENIPAEVLLGLNENSSGTFFVEDRVAADLLTVILEDRLPFLLRTYTIESVGGEAEISSRLSFPYSDKIKYQFIGIYDGDMKDSLDASKLNWKYCFLPGDKAFEEILRGLVHDPQNIGKLCDFLSKNKDEVIAILAKIDGLDCHDWFEEFRKSLAVEGKMLLIAFYQTILKDQKIVDDFVKSLDETLHS